MDSLTIRVKRRRSQLPVDVLLLEEEQQILKKKPKPLLEAFDALSIAKPVKFAFRRKEFPPVKTVQRALECTEQRSKAAAEDRLARKLQYRVLDLELDEIQCDGTPLIVCRKPQAHTTDQDYEQDEYELQELEEADNQYTTAFFSANLLEPQLVADEGSESVDSEDSNAEGRSENDYPDEYGSSEEGDFEERFNSDRDSDDEVY